MGPSLSFPPPPPLLFLLSVTGCGERDGGGVQPSQTQQREKRAKTTQNEGNRRGEGNYESAPPTATNCTAYPSPPPLPWPQPPRTSVAVVAVRLSLASLPLLDPPSFTHSFPCFLSSITPLVSLHFAHSLPIFYVNPRPSTFATFLLWSHGRVTETANGKGTSAKFAGAREEWGGG